MLDIENVRLIFKGIVGSQSYGLGTETSDVDIKGVYIQTDGDILSNRYVPQIDVDKDTVYFEIRRFLELVSTGNPNVLELLYLPENCILQTSPEWEELLKVKEEFLSKKCYDTFSGYARTQLGKASGLNKKFNWEKSRTERKDILDFCKVLDREDGKTYNLKEWFELNEFTNEATGLASIDGFRDGYRLYIGQNYKGVGDVDTNQPRTSIIPKDKINDWMCFLYFNREAYSTHCKDYNLYTKWLRERNENRVATNKKHGQDFDGKNIMHTVRLIMTAKEIPLQNRINVDRGAERDYLLSIKKGEVDLKQIMDQWSVEANNLKELYDNSSLKDEVDSDFVKVLELKIRKLCNFIK